MTFDRGDLARILAGAVVVLAVSSVDGCAEAAEVDACPKHSEAIRLASNEHGVPTMLLAALVFSESSCDQNAVNERTGAIGLGQVLLTGAGAGYTEIELRNPWVNAWLSARHLAHWRARCGHWRGAIAVYHGNSKCSTRSKYADCVMRRWKRLEKESEPRS